MDKDIVPELLKLINEEFDSKTLKSAKLKNAIKLLKSKKVNYLDVNDFAIEVGEILAGVFKNNITADVLPDSKMYYNIADRILNQTLQKNYELISNYAIDVQTILNHEAGLRLKAQAPALNQNRIDGLVNKLTEYDDFELAKWLLDEPIVNFSQSVVDDAIKANADFHFNAGLSPKITRRVSGHACEWCKNLSGTYDYHSEPDDIYRRHERCRCTVEYNPKDGRGVQNSHSKKWREEQKRAKIEERKQVGLSQYLSNASGAKNYFRDSSEDFLRSPEEIRKDSFAYLQYDAIKNSNQSIEKRKIYSNIGKFKNMKDFSKKDIDIAFNHVFNDIHELENGLSLFKPDYDMAQSWNRLINGNSIQAHDLLLLRHERLEHDYMYVVDKLDYDSAHAKTNKSYDYNSNIPKGKGD
ncbi:hypothetical protein IGI37_002269 [Enterococcus sp. AZ194]|uniref:hypothetical protein n=1 Tax=Enterococcus sp. AZ194 TaxID=2774629 RepID=UPI003F209CE1